MKSLTFLTIVLALTTQIHAMDQSYPTLSVRERKDVKVEIIKEEYFEPNILYKVIIFVFEHWSNLDARVKSVENIFPGFKIISKKEIWDSWGEYADFAYEVNFLPKQLILKTELERVLDIPVWKPNSIKVGQAAYEECTRLPWKQYAFDMEEAH